MTADGAEARRAGDPVDPEAPDTLTGLVLACFHDEWEVALDGGDVVRTSVRARHFAGLAKEEKLLVPGDHVRVVRDADAYVIEESLPRETSLSRLLPGTRRPTEQVIIANVEQLVAVASFVRPSLNRRLLDRFLVIAEDAELECVVVLNKIDLVEEDEWRRHAAVYEGIGYEVVPSCALDGRGVERLEEIIAGRFSVFAGPSGSGKSSLLNVLEPGLGIKVREVSEKTLKGKHTTSNVTVFRLDNGSLVADTPGFRELGFWRIGVRDLGFLFPEFREHLRDCRYGGSCLHSPEPGCAVKEAVAAGSIDADRHDSYVRLLEEIQRGAGRPTGRTVERPGAVGVPMDEDPDARG